MTIITLLHNLILENWNKRSNQLFNKIRWTLQNWFSGMWISVLSELKYGHLFAFWWCWNTFSFSLQNIVRVSRIPFQSILQTVVYVIGKLLLLTVDYRLFPLRTFYIYVSASQKHLNMEIILLRWKDIPELVVPIMISLVEGCC